MREWYSASDLAGLPGLPTTERRVRSKAQRDGWKSRKKEKGKGLEYHITALPRETRQHLAIEQVSRVSVCHEAALQLADPDREARFTAKQEGLKRWAALPANHPKKKRAVAREWVLRSLAEFARVHSTSNTAAAELFVQAYLAGDIAVPAEYLAWLPQRAGQPSLNRATVMRWLDRYREQGRAGLMDGHGKRKGKSKIAEHEPLRNVVLELVRDYPHITPKKIKAYLEAEHPDLDIVSVKSIERFLKSWKQENAQLWTYLVNPDAWKNQYMVAFGSQHESIERLHQLWEMDSTPADWMLKDGRHSVIGVIDMYSRQLRFHVSRTSRAQAVGLAFRKASEAWGNVIPEAVRTDNGKDYTAKYFDAVLADLEIPHLLCLPFASEEKGTIERAMRTMSHGILDLLPGFIGHNVGERKAIEARKSFADRIMTPGDVVEIDMTAEQLQARLDEWCEQVYAHDYHNSLGRTPFQAFTAWTGQVRRLTDTRALDALLLEIAGTRTVTKKGVRYEHHDYIAPELVGHVGREVTARRDDDLGRLFVYGLDGEFICIARCHELLGISRKEVAVASKAGQKKLMAAHAKALKATKSAVKRNPAQAILEHRISQAQNVTLLPPRGSDYSTPALEQHGRAARATDPIQPSTTDIDMAAFQAQFEQASKPAQVIEADDAVSRYRYWQRVQQRIDSGEHVSQTDRDRLQRYRRSDEYRSMQEIYEKDFKDFGRSVDTETA